MKAKPINEKKFNRLVFLTIIVVYLVILAGGIVRSTGSGMGCPDWPKCFGQWVPPTTESELPADYQEQFAQIRVEKNSRLAEYLQLLGFTKLATAIQNESIAAPEEKFNKYKTWTEYINRLIGVLAGFLVALMVAASTRFRKVKPAIFYGSVAAFLLIGFQGWIGSIVVSTNLLPGMITFHMALAALLIGVLLYLLYISSDRQIPVANNALIKRIKLVLLATIVLFSIQVAIGSQVREAIDVVAMLYERRLWIDNLENIFYLHRTYSLFLLMLCGYLVVLLRQSENPQLIQFSSLLMLFLVFEIVLGIVMASYAVPAWAQPLHLLFGLLILGVQYWLYLNTKIFKRA
jgi:cytochrome c oxidase assembly protein subunit 15